MRLQPVYDIAEICFRKGIREAILCPGSRCAPLTLSFVRHPGVNTRTISDERSAAFIAMGIAHQTSKPVVLICTSGSAAYNFAPAVAEAFFQQLPLVIITADRPLEWIGQLDGQTIDQQSIYGSHVKRSFQIREDIHPDNDWSINREVNEAINLCDQWPRGPVHLNVSLREPLYPSDGETIAFTPNLRIIEPVVTRHHLPGRLTQSLSAQLQESRKTLIIVGQQDFSINLIAAVHAFCSAYRAPLVGEIISNMHPLPSRIAHSDIILGGASTDLQEALRPDLLITFGKSLLSRNLKQFIRRYKPSEHWHIQEGVDQLRDPLQSITRTITASPEDFFSLLSKTAPTAPSPSYLDAWMREDQKAAEAVQSFFADTPGGEFRFMYEVMNRIPDHVVLHLSNSMAVRYANLLSLSEKKKGVQVFANRGTSGIDGCTSTAVGHALSDDDNIHVLITGDMAFFYDQNAFWNNYSVPNLRIILINNHGGAIFGMIDGPQGLPEAKEYFITNQARTAKFVAQEFGFDYTRVQDPSEASSMFENFFRLDGRTKMIEFETFDQEAQRIFLDFKQKMRKVYEAKE
jgi:2-succinyl-5-enolpyruvyl-6-hydroxy-3-cyclohexene-1-carboxylate synthase